MVLGGGGGSGGDGDGVCAASNCIGGGADDYGGVSDSGDFGLVVLTTFGTISHDGGDSEEESDEEEEEVE